MCYCCFNRINKICTKAHVRYICNSVLAKFALQFLWNMLVDTVHVLLYSYCLLSQNCSPFYPCTRTRIALQAKIRPRQMRARTVRLLASFNILVRRIQPAFVAIVKRRLQTFCRIFLSIECSYARAYIRIVKQIS